MSEIGTFYNEGQLDLARVVTPYQEAFKGWPWYEVSKCVDQEPVQRCVGALSKVAIKETCYTCNLSPTQPAYEANELIARFENLEATRPTRWYTESVNENLALVALAWAATPETIAVEKYSNVPEMQNWLVDTLGNEPIIWLDEVFADKSVRQQGNLNNFRYMNDGFMSALGTDRLAYRTISPAMVRAAEKNFGATPTLAVPDKRAFITIKGEA